MQIKITPEGPSADTAGNPTQAHLRVEIDGKVMPPQASIVITGKVMPPQSSDSPTQPADADTPT